MASKFPACFYFSQLGTGKICRGFQKLDFLYEFVKMSIFSSKIIEFSTARFRCKMQQRHTPFAATVSQRPYGINPTIVCLLITFIFVSY